jgi:HK97 family phage prohead protease
MRFYWPIAKVDAEQRMVWGYASTEAEDDQGETVTRAALAAALDDYMKFANIREMHQNSAVGVAREASVDDRGLYLAAKIVDDDAWRKVTEGVYKGFSIGGRVTARHHTDRRTITGLALTEISVVDRPANPEAVFDCWKRAVSGDARPSLGADRTEPEHDPHVAVDYADPGYQPDAKPRYPLDSERHIRAAWAYIHQAHNARRYTPGQLARIRSRIVAAWQARIDAAGPPEAAAAAARRPADAARKGVPPILRLRLLIAELCDVADALDGDAPGDEDWPLADIAALAGAGALRKSGAAQADLAPLADRLAKFAGEIVPRLDALQQRVEDIARTPLPAQTAARGFTGLIKRDDGSWAAPSADADIVAALAHMTDEERTLVLIKAARAAPLRR